MAGSGVVHGRTHCAAALLKNIQMKNTETVLPTLAPFCLGARVCTPDGNGWVAESPIPWW